MVTFKRTTKAFNCPSSIKVCFIRAIISDQRQLNMNTQPLHVVIWLYFIAHCTTTVHCNFHQFMFFKIRYLKHYCRYRRITTSQYLHDIVVKCFKSKLWQLLSATINYMTIIKRDLKLLCREGFAVSEPVWQPPNHGRTHFIVAFASKFFEVFKIHEL